MMVGEVRAQTDNAHLLRCVCGFVLSTTKVTWVFALMPLLLVNLLE
jgi:hypothetical protein